MTDAPHERARWEARYAGASTPRAPSAWVMDTIAALAAGVTVVDIAGGAGRHAIPLARAGRRVVLVDFVEAAVREATAAVRGIVGVVADASALPLRARSVGIALCTNFLDRSLFPHVVSLLRPGGYLVYETYTVAHLELVASGEARAPSSRRFLLEPGELPGLVAPLEVLLQREGLVRDAAGVRHCASVLARRDPLA